MRMLRRWLWRLAVAALVLVVLGAGAIGLLVWATVPGGDLRAAIPGLSAPVSVTIDADGVPRIRAANMRDADAALGFLHARSRLFQMDLMRRATGGTLAALVGPAALGNDELMRTLGVRRAARAELAHLPPETLARLDAYSRGVNAWIARRGRFSALEYLWFGKPQPWTPLDCLLWGKAMALYLSGDYRQELARAGLARHIGRAAALEFWPTTDGTPSDAELVPRRGGLDRFAWRLVWRLAGLSPRLASASEASNAWAVDAAHSTTGAPLLAGDPHLAFGLPGIWFLARIDTPDQTLAGATAPGVPFLVLGHNRDIAWTFTSNGAHVQDLFVERLVGDGKYATPEGPRAFDVRHAVIDVAGGTTVLLTVRSSRHGPIISDLDGRGGPPVAVEMANLAPGDTAATGLLDLNEATSVAAAGRAAAAITAPVQNLMVAGRHHIGLFVTGRVPIRRSGHGLWPEEGADGAHDWIGWASGEALPHRVDPASGKLVNANNKVATPGFPVFLGRHWFGTWRARRITRLLDAKPKFMPDDFRKMQTDTVSLLAREVLPRFLALKLDDAAKPAQDLLRGWNGDMTTGAPQPLILDATLRRFRLLLLHRLDVPLFAAAPWPEFTRYALSPAGAHWCGGDCDALLARAFQGSVTALTHRYGPDPAKWRWGAAHQAVFANPLLARLPLVGRFFIARIAAPGDNATIDAGGIGDTPLANLDDIHGPSYRGVYDLADLDQSRFVVAPGQAGNPFSRLATNFLRRWRDGAMVKLGPKPDKVVARITLEPTR